MKRATAMMAAAALLGTSALAHAADTKIGILMDITGPIANFIPPLQNAVNLAVKQVNASGGLLDGNAVAVFGDTTGSAQGSVDAVGKLANIENVPVIMGALMSGTTIAAAEAVSIPAGIVQISPTATSAERREIRNDVDWIPDHESENSLAHARHWVVLRCDPGGGEGARED